MEEQQDKPETELDEEGSRIDRFKLSINTKENAQSTLKCTNDTEDSPCTNTFIVNEDEAKISLKMATSSKPFECSTPIVEDEEITTSNMATNQDRVRMALNDHDLLYQSDDSDEDEDEDDNMMTIIEKVIKDFDDRHRLESNRHNNESLELINLSKSSDETEDRNDRIEEMMSWNPDETKKFQALRTPNVDQDQGHAGYSQKPGLVHLLSINVLLREATSQLRTKFKQFLSDLDLRTNTFKSPQIIGKNLISTSNCTGGKFGNKAKFRATKGPRMSVLEIIEVSRRARRKKLAQLRKSNANKSIVAFTKHFDTDGSCIRNDGHDDILSILTRDPEHKRIMRRALFTLLLELRKCDRLVVNISLEKEDQVKDITERQDELCDRILNSKTIEKEEIRGVDCKKLMRSLGPMSKVNMPKRQLRKTFHHLRIKTACPKRRSGNKLNCHTDSRDDKQETPLEKVFTENNLDINVNTASTGTNSSHPMKSSFNEDNEPSNLSTTLIGTSQASNAAKLHLQNDPIEDHDEVEKTYRYTEDSKTCSRNNEKDDQPVANLNSTTVEKPTCPTRNLSTDVFRGSPCSDLSNEDILSSSFRTPSDNGDDVDLNPYSLEELIPNIESTSRMEPHQKEVACDDVEGSNMSDEGGPSRNSASTGREGDDGGTFDESSENVCTNLQSTCLYSGVGKEILMLETVVVLGETDISDELENLGDYEDFVKPLLEGARRMSGD